MYRDLAWEEFEMNRFIVDIVMGCTMLLCVLCSYTANLIAMHNCYFIVTFCCGVIILILGFSRYNE